MVGPGLPVYPMTVLETARLRLRLLTAGDAPFIRRLVNDPDWLRYIGERHVHSDEDAVKYIRNGPAASYEKNGFGLWLVELKAGGTPIGMCGLIRRDTLPDVDLGFAYLPEFRGQGYAVEAGQASLAHGRTKLGLKRIVAITAPDNHGSIKVIEKLGLRFERVIHVPGYGAESKLFASEA